MDLHEDAINKIMDDMDGMEAKKMTGGATITITVSPGGAEGHEEPDGDEYPEGHDAALCGGGCAYHKGGEVASTAEELPGVPKMAGGGAVQNAAVPAEVDDMRLPPFLRKKKAV